MLFPRKPPVAQGKAEPFLYRQLPCQATLFFQFSLTRADFSSSFRAFWKRIRNPPVSGDPSRTRIAQVGQLLPQVELLNVLTSEASPQGNLGHDKPHSTSYHSSQLATLRRQATG